MVNNFTGKQQVALVGATAAFILSLSLNLSLQAPLAVSAQSTYVQETLSSLAKQRDMEIEAINRSAGLSGEVDRNGHNLIDGESARKIEAIERKYATLMDATTARSIDARQRALTKVNAFPGKSANRAEYIITEPSTHAEDSNQELYQSAESYFTVDPKTDTITSYGPIVYTVEESNALINETERFTVAQLREIAMQVAADQGVDLNGLKYTLNNKDKVYFFRWEDTSRMLVDGKGLSPFIQFAYTRNGDLLTYANTLGL